MATEIPRVDAADVAAGGTAAAKEALSKGEAIVRVYAFPAPELRIRAKKRLIRLNEGKLARLVYSLIRAAAEGGGSFTFRKYGDLVGDYKAAAAYLASLVAAGLVKPEEESVMTDLVVAANALSQKTYERRISRLLEKNFKLVTEEVKKLPSDEILCVQRNDMVACRYVVANTPRGIAKAQVRALIDLAGYRPA